MSKAASLDLSGLRHSRELRNLSLPADRQGIGPDRAMDLRQFRWLEEFRGEWSPKLQLGPECPALRTLHRWKYHSKSHDLTQFSELTALRELSLLQTKLTHLDGAARLSGVRNLEFYACQTLVFLEGVVLLADSPLEALKLERCRKVADYRPLGMPRYVKRLSLVESADIDSLEFLSGRAALEGLGFLGTNVVSGDLPPLLRHPCLTFVGTLDKRHGSHRAAGINQVLQARNTPLGA